MLLTHLQWSKINCKSALVLRACLQGGGGPQVGEVILSYQFWERRHPQHPRAPPPPPPLAGHFPYYVNVMKLFIRDLKQ